MSKYQTKSQKQVSKQKHRQTEVRNLELQKAKTELVAATVEIKHKAAARRLFFEDPIEFGKAAVKGAREN